MVQCDKNTTNASEEDDIFTLARDRGATGAVSIQFSLIFASSGPHVLSKLLYSLTAETCQINAEYADPDVFEQILDIFATPTKAVAG